MALNVEVTKTLETLKDLDGVFGSFVVVESGAVVAQDLPSYFGSAAYDVGPRVQRFQEVLSMVEGEIGQCVLRFGDHKLALRKVNGALLTIVGSSDVNMSALRMATNLVARKLASQKLDVEEVTAPPPPTVRPPGEKSMADEPPPADHGARSRRRQPSMGAPEAGNQPRNTKRAIYFRGKRIR